MTEQELANEHGPYLVARVYWPNKPGYFEYGRIMSENTFKHGISLMQFYSDDLAHAMLNAYKEQADEQSGPDTLTSGS